MFESLVRPTIEELKSDWCNGDCTIIAAEFEPLIYAMPRFESTKSRKYMELLVEVKTYAEAQELFQSYSRDPNAPRLTPVLFDLKANLESLDQRVQQDYLSRKVWNSERWESSLDDAIKSPGFADLKLDFECSIETLWEEVRELPFVLADDPCYNADEIPRFATQAHLWTDFWVPEIIANEIGTPDNGHGLDYQPAEFDFLDLERFIQTFEKYGFEVVVDNRLMNYLVWEWTQL